jgi:hypothetical protein
MFPLFSARTSNYTFIHELNRSFVIQCFKKCDMEYFDVISYAHPGKFIEGSAGLISFENEAGGIFLGTQAELPELVAFSCRHGSGEWPPSRNLPPRCFQWVG